MDTGVLYALTDHTDTHHRACSRWLVLGCRDLRHSMVVSIGGEDRSGGTNRVRYRTAGVGHFLPARVVVDGYSTQAVAAASLNARRK